MCWVYLSIDHFTGRGRNKGRKYHTNTRLPIDQLLVNGSTVQSFKLKRWLYELVLKQAACKLCGWAEVSADGRIPVELDHINGEHTDNRLENLRILCPTAIACSWPIEAVIKKRASALGGPH